MKQLILILTLLSFSIISVPSYASTSKDQAITIFLNIVKANGFSDYPSLIFSDSPEMNAHMSGSVMTINQGMLDRTTVSELALVIGHELGHYKLGHSSSTPSNELAADRAGWDYASNAGYNVCKGKDLFKKLGKKASKTHPGGDERFDKLPKC